MTRTTNRKSLRRPLGPAFLPKLQDLVNQEGVQAAANRLALHKQTLLSLLAGQPANGSTVALVEHLLSAGEGGEGAQ